ncbi:hypothetical protein ALC62_04156 [Cyphomyrmex costatus]|uniref:Endonuclease/exonuclease/phosphatase domain-containing protein n=1 Tax=Cyphomyrmex costatus TaxID=456900 RepID=A0A151IKF3_9HYME|nr:hypothetical protein ALC62_04156 [Cyphomyrmex costatus]
MGGEKREQRVRGIFWNVAGLKNKETDFWEFLGNFEIIGLLETWIDEKEWGKLKEKMPKEWRWKCQPADRDKRRGRAKGGIITGIRKEIEENKEELESREGIQERKIILNGEKWRVVTIYNREGRKKGLEDMQEVIKEEEGGKMVMVGDFNARIGKEGGVRTLSGEEKRPEEGKRVSKDKVINKQGKELLRMIDRFEIGCRIESDHQPIIIDFGGRYARKEEVADEVGRIQDWSEEGINIYKEKIEKIEWKGEDVQEGWEELESEINSAVVWKRTGKRRGLGGSPWWDRECREKKREVNKVRKRYREGEERWENFIRCRREYREACRVKEELHKKREEEEIENIRTESQAWNFINKGRKKREGISKEIKMIDWVNTLQRIRKATIAMGWVWGYGERKFKGDVRWRLKLFDSIVKGILYYGVEIWGYREWKEVEALQEKYLRWILGVDRVTPGYIVREELRRNKLRIETGWRAGRYEERLEKGEGGEIGKRCMLERRKNEREGEMSMWTEESIERRDYLWRGGVSQEGMSEWGVDKWERVRERDIEVDEQVRGEKVRGSRLCVDYKRVNDLRAPEYIRKIKRNEGKKL